MKHSSVDLIDRISYHFQLLSLFSSGCKEIVASGQQVSRETRFPLLRKLQQFLVAILDILLLQHFAVLDHHSTDLSAKWSK